MTTPASRSVTVSFRFTAAVPVEPLVLVVETSEPGSRLSQRSSGPSVPAEQVGRAERLVAVAGSA